MSEVKEDLNSLVKKHGKRKVKAAIEEVFSKPFVSRVSKKEQEYREIAETLFSKYPKPVAKQQSIRNIMALLRRGVKPQYLNLAVERYRQKLKYQTKIGKPVPSEYWWQSNNFFGEAAYWQDCLTEEELMESKNES